MKAPTDIGPIERVLSDNFSGCSLAPNESRLVRPGPSLEVRQNKFADQAILGPGSFLEGMKLAMSAFSKIVTAEFQVIAIEASPGSIPDWLRTRVRYDLVGSGPGFHREQRVGEWGLEWQPDALRSDFRLRKWRTP